MMGLRLITFLLIGTAISLAEDDWTLHCDKCKCMWSNGRKSADCKNAYLSQIPRNMSTEVREIDFSNNPLYELGSYAFQSVNLHDLHKLKFQNCSLETVHKTAFANLLLLIELDLSNNSIVSIDTNLFQYNLKLRVLDLSRNKLQVLQEGIFKNMTHLQRVYVSHNEIKRVDVNAFQIVPMLQHIDFEYNQLTLLNGDLIEKLGRLSSFSVQGNPWICDCNLRLFRDLATKRNLITTPVECSQPERLKGRLWRDLRANDFACIPKIEEPALDTRLEVNSINFTMVCKVTGNPLPDVDWVSNGRIIDRDPRQNVQKYVTSKNDVDYTIWNNLTIINVNYRDRGEYKCVAKNPGGVDEKNISLVILGDKGSGVFGAPSGLGSALPLIIGLGIGAIFLLLLIIVLICCCCKRNRRGHSSKGTELGQSSDYISLNGMQEMQKSLITAVNPVEKPPRQHTAPASVISGVTEVSDVKRTLLDDDSVYGDDESRSFDFESRIPNKFHNNLDVDYRGERPDLLSFPLRAAQVSPAGSTASTVADHSRLPQLHGPQSPLESPLYDMPKMYRTLPHSRSQSPFITPFGAPIITPRQGGYVTIPRRPRASWSSEPPPQTDEFGEPVYDNLGLRTTASGSSVLSLNKIGTEASTPRATRAVPPAANFSSIACDPIAEQESPPTAATLPRSVSAHRALSPSAENYRNLWVRNGSDTSSLRSSVQPNSRRESTSSLLPTTPDAKITKIPPRPPPKPKKRTSTGPLFEDEGEDGTEV